jgi:hypothetical protein
MCQGVLRSVDRGCLGCILCQTRLKLSSEVDECKPLPPVRQIRPPTPRGGAVDGDGRSTAAARGAAPVRPGTAVSRAAVSRAAAIACDVACERGRRGGVTCERRVGGNGRRRRRYERAREGRSEARDGRGGGPTGGGVAKSVEILPRRDCRVRPRLGSHLMTLLGRRASDASSRHASRPSRRERLV